MPITVKPSNAKLIIDKLKQRKMYCLQIEEENHKKFYKKVRLVQNKVNESNLNKETPSSSYSKNDNNVEYNKYEDKKKYWREKIVDIDTDFIDYLYQENLLQVINSIDVISSSISNKSIINDYNERKDSYYNNKLLKEILNEDLTTKKKKKELTLTIDYENIINVSYLKKEETISNTSSNSNKVEPILKFTDETNSEKENTSSEITVRDYNTDSINDTSDSCNELFL